MTTGLFSEESKVVKKPSAVKAPQKSEVLFLDTEQHQKESYFLLMQLCNATDNLTFRYAGFSEILDEKVKVDAKIIPLSIIVNISKEFLQKMGNSQVGKSGCDKIKKIISSAKAFNKNLNIILSIPQMSNPSFELIEKILSTLAIKLIDNSAMTFVPNDAKLFLRSTVEEKIRYATTLATRHAYIDGSNPKNVLDVALVESFYIKTKDQEIQDLATDKKLSKGQEVKLLRSDILYTLGPTDNYRITTIKPEIQNAFQNLVEHNLRKALKLKDVINLSDIKHVGSGSISNDALVKSSSTQQEAHAWLNLNLDKGRDDKELGFSVDKLCQNLSQGNITGVWMQPAINEIFGAKGIRNSSAMQTRFNVRVHQIVEGLSKLNFHPSYYFSVELMNNYPATEVIKDCNKDIFGSEQTDLADPLDYDFFAAEIIAPLKAQIESMSKAKIRNAKSDYGFSLVLDLEMYLRKSGSLYSSVSGFSKKCLSKYFKNDRDGISKLLEAKGFSKYFTWLEGQAYELGKKIIQELIPLVKGRMVGVYIPAIPLNWFYKGFLKGLSSTKSINLYTFCSNFTHFDSLWKSQQLNHNHFAVFMISKLNQPDWKVVLNDAFGKKNKGVWINRFDRLGQAYQDGSYSDSRNSFEHPWFEMEQTYADKETKSKLLKKLNKKSSKNDARKVVGKSSN